MLGGNGGQLETTCMHRIYAGAVATTTTPARYMHGHRRMEEEIKKRSTAQLAYTPSVLKCKTF